MVKRLRCDYGNSTIEDVEEYLKRSVNNTQNPSVYVKGVKKLKRVRPLSGEEICTLNLDDFSCSNIDNLHKTYTNANLCNWHRQKHYCCCQRCKYRCAVKNVDLLRHFVKFNLNKDNIKNA